MIQNGAVTGWDHDTTSHTRCTLKFEITVECLADSKRFCDTNKAFDD